MSFGKVTISAEPIKRLSPAQQQPVLSRPSYRKLVSGIDTVP